MFRPIFNNLNAANFLPSLKILSLAKGIAAIASKDRISAHHDNEVTFTLILLIIRQDPQQKKLKWIPKKDNSEKS